jgi:hypothetical protein
MLAFGMVALIATQDEILFIKICICNSHCIAVVAGKTKENQK